MQKVSAISDSEITPVSDQRQLFDAINMGWNVAHCSAQKAKTQINKPPRQTSTMAAQG